jgi:NTP pyrophosphatase (non-canonical NTP hydrolase)
MTDAASLTIASFQQHIAARYAKVDRERGWAKTFPFLIEEVGELATALTREAKTPEDRENLEDEFADVIAWLCTLANITDVDLAAALKRKYLSEAPPQGHK